MKRILSIVLALVMVCSFMAFSASAAAATPIITVTSNASNPAAAGDVTLKLHLNKFDAVAAAKIDITFEEGVTFKSLVGDKFVATQGKNFVYNEATRTLTIIDLFKIAQSELALTVNVASSDIATYTVTVNGLAIGSDEQAVTVDWNNGAVAIGVNYEDKNVTGNVDGETATHFVPQGGVFDANGFVDKGTDGNFTLANESTVRYFKLPATGKKLTTFSAGTSVDGKSLQFGTYVAERVDGATYGTMLIASENYEAFMNYYHALGLNDDEIMIVIMKNYQKLAANLGDKKYITFKAGNVASIDVYDVEQTKFMWGNENPDSFQYSLKVNNIQDERTYVGVGYQFVGGEYTFSTEIKSATL